MKLLIEIHKLSKAHERNFVAKHAKRSGAGAHKDKTGPNAPRNRQKQQWKKEVQQESYETN